MMECPEKIWSDYDWSGTYVVFAYPSRPDSWVWDADSGAIMEVATSALPPAVMGSLFHAFEG